MAKTNDPEFESFNYFEKIYDKAKINAILLMDDESIITSINEAFTKNFGYRPKDLIGKNARILYTEEDKNNRLPERELKEILRKGQASDNNYLVSKDGNKVWVNGESVLVKDEKGRISIVKVIQNIHQQKVAEAQLKKSNDFNENILSSIEDVVIVLDEKMNVLKANKAFAKLFKVEDVDVTSLNFKNLIEPYDINDDLNKSIHKTINNKIGFFYKQVEIETGGEKRIFDVSCSPMEYDTKNVLLVVHDITIHKQTEREREDIIGFVAHELRNPLANLVLCNDVMASAIIENNLEEIDDMLKRSKNNIMRLNKMIAELYDAAKVNSGNLRLEISTFNFEEMVEEAIETIKGLQPSYNIVTKGSGNIKVSGDRYRLIQVVTNYLSNGIKYSNGKTDVLLTMSHDADTVTLSVKDEGLGISKKQLPYIFERFFRAEKTKNLEGIGLGLYLCRQIIVAHNGNVWAESEEGKGSTFYFSIPRN